MSDTLQFPPAGFYPKCGCNGSDAVVNWGIITVGYTLTWKCTECGRELKLEKT